MIVGWKSEGHEIDGIFKGQQRIQYSWHTETKDVEN